MTDNKGNIVQYFFPIYGFADAFHGQDFVSNLAFRTEINIRIFPAGWFDIVQFNFFQRSFSGGRLLGLGSIGGEAGDKFLQFLNLFFLFLIGFLTLLDNELAGFIPEIIVAGV